MVPILAGLNWASIPYSAPLPPSTHMPLAVVEIQEMSYGSAKPGARNIAFFHAPVLPPHPLAVGMPVHLYLLCSREPTAAAPRDLTSAVAVPTRVAGRIAGEKTRKGEEVEYLLKNDIPGALVHSAHIRVRALPGMSVQPDLTPALVQRLRVLVETQSHFHRAGCSEDVPVKLPIHPETNVVRSGPFAWSDTRRARDHGGSDGFGGPSIEPIGTRAMMLMRPIPRSPAQYQILHTDSPASTGSIWGGWLRPVIPR